MDISNAAIAGHSFGGATAIATAAFSTDFKVCNAFETMVHQGGWIGCSCAYDSVA